MPDETAPRPDVSDVPDRHDRLAAAMLTPLIDHGLREAVKWVMEPELLAMEAEIERQVRERVAAEHPLIAPEDLAELLHYVVGKDAIRVISDATLDRAFAALKALDAHGEGR